MALDFQLPPQGFQSYLNGILPLDQAVVAGAFSVSMQQVRNISQVDLERWAQVVASIETNYGLNLTNGTDVPTDSFIVNQALRRTALGSGPYGTYTMSDALGAMSGLPYPYEQIYTGIKELQTDTLTSIYQNIYLAVKWEQATLSFTLGNSSPSNWFIDSISINNPGGGYGREGSATPTISLPYGASASCTIGTDPNDLSTYGKLTSVTLISGGSHSNDGGWYATVDAPPGSGWPGMNAIIDNYVQAAQNEIEAIQNASDSNFEKAKVLNTNWNITGTALKIEQRCRYIAMPPVPAPYDRFLTNYPTALYVFADTIPEIAQDTGPHGGAQTLENIVDYCTVGGQSLVNMMRQERNQARLKEVGIELDNNIPNTLQEELEKLLAANGTAPLAVEGVPSPVGDYTLPAFPSTQECVTPDGGENVGPGGGPTIAPIPDTYYDPNLPGLRTTTTPGLIPTTTTGNITPILIVTNAGPFDDGLGGPGINSDIPAGLPVGDPVTTVVVNTNVPPVGTGLPVTPTNIQGIDGPLVPDGIPTGLPPNTNLYPSPIPPVLTPNLDSKYNNSTLLPSSYPIADAIDKVIECNCDCWVM